MAKKRRLRAKNRMGVVVPYDIAADDVTMGNGKSVESDIAGIKQAIRTLHATLGNYAFPGGKPDINFDGGGGGGSDTQSAEIAYSLGQKVTAQGAGNLINMYDELTVQLGTNDNLYVIDPSTVRVTMGNVEQEDVYDEETDTIHIAVVTGDVEIEAEAMTYVGYGEQNSDLVSMFDGKNRGGTSGQWVDKMDETRVIGLNQYCVEQSDHVYFNGSSAVAEAENANVGVDVLSTVGTIEYVAAQQQELQQTGAFAFPIINMHKDNSRLLVVGINKTSSNTLVGFSQALYSGDTSVPNAWILPSGYATSYLSLSNDRAYLNGNPLSRASSPYSALSHTNSRLGMFSFKSSATPPTQYYNQGSLYCVRYYKKKLSADEVLQNYKVDRKRFNLT